MQEAITKTLLGGSLSWVMEVYHLFSQTIMNYTKGEVHIGLLHRYAFILLSVMLLYFICKSRNLLKQIY